MKLFVGNLSWDATEEALKASFEAFGTVVSVKIVTDQQTGRSKGFGFIEMEDDASANAALTGLDNQSFLGRPLRVSVARQEQPGSRGNGGRSFDNNRGGDRRPSYRFRDN